MNNFILFILYGILFFSVNALGAPYNNGNGDEDMPTTSGGCSDALGCHTTGSPNGSVSLNALADDGTWNTPGESGTITATGNIDPANSNSDILGVALLDPDLGWDNIKAKGWTITEDPNTNSTPFNYNERGSAVGDVILTWRVNAPGTPGTYRVVGRLLFDDGGARHNQSSAVVIDLSVGIEEEDKSNLSNPTSLFLQTRPNPFHSFTTITYSVPGSMEENSQRVNISVYDLRGRLVENLVDEGKAPGVYHLQWEGRIPESGVRSGIYFFRLKVGEFNTTKKLIILR
jgi:hypothetical protein